MTKNIFASIFAWIVNCYDNSFFEKIMSSVFAFFKNGSKSSVIVGLFSGKKDKKLWSDSISAKIVRSPFYILRAFYHKNESVIEGLKEKSSIYGFLKNPGKYSLRDYGTLVLSLSVGMLFGVAVFMKWTDWLSLAVVAAAVVIGAFMVLTDNSCTCVLSGSKIMNIGRKIINNDIYEKEKISEHFLHLNGLWFVMILLGFLAMAISPVAVFVSIAAVIAFAMIMWKTELGVFLFVPLSAILPTMVLAGIVGITFVSYILHLMFGKNAEYKSTSFQPWIAVFIGFTVISALTSADIMSSLKILMIYILFTLAYVLVVNTIKTRSQWTALIILFVIASTAVALYGIWQNFFLDTTTQSWVDEEMFSDIKKRVFSTLDNPNVLGEYFIMLIPVAFALLLKMRGSMQKVLYTVCNTLMFLCLLYTWSRGAWLGVVIGIVFFILLKDRRWLVICIAGLLLMPSVLPVSVMERLMSIGNVKDSSTAYRVSIWLGSLKMLQDYWICGVGLGSDAFLAVYPRYALGGADFALHSHNFYLQWIVDLGIVGIFVYIGIIITGFKKIASVKEKNSVLKNVMLAMSGALCGYLFQGLAENLWYNYRMILVFWIYFGIIASGAIIAADEVNRKDVIR